MVDDVYCCVDDFLRLWNSESLDTKFGSSGGLII